MEKRKYPKIYKSSEVSLKQVGKFETKGMMLPYGTPLYVVVNSKGQQIYPKVYPNLLHMNKGEAKERCNEWIRNFCWNPEDKSFRKSLLEKMMRMDDGQKIEDIVIVKNELKYEGERHAEFSLVFKQGEEHYRFGYIDYCGLHLGRWMGKSLDINDIEYLCKRVKPNERTIKVTDFEIG